MLIVSMRHFPLQAFAQQWCRSNMKILRGPLAEGEDAPSYCVKAGKLSNARSWQMLAAPSFVSMK
jgi:hypothetical protein